MLACLLIIFFVNTGKEVKLKGLFSLAIAYTFGCFKDTARRAIAPLDGRSRLLKGNYKRRWDAVRKCALASAMRRYHVFAVQDGGWCVSARRAHITFGKYGKTNKCRNGKGGPWANSVYVLRGVYTSEFLGTLVLQGNFARQSEQASAVERTNQRFEPNACGRCFFGRKTNWLWLCL